MFFKREYLTFDLVCTQNHKIYTRGINIYDCADTYLTCNFDYNDEGAEQVSKCLKNAGTEREKWDLLVSYGSPLDSIYVHNTREDSYPYIKYKEGKKTDKIYYYKLKKIDKYIQCE